MLWDPDLELTSLPFPFHPAQMAKSYCADIFEVMRTLKRTRDMSVAEIKVSPCSFRPKACR
jgi:hypothetical protein